MSKTVQPRQPTREGQALKREDERLRERADASILNGRLTGFQKIAATSTADIKHGLGRTPNGYFIRLRSTANLTAPVREVSADSNVIQLKNENADAVEVDLWVF